MHKGSLCHSEGASAVSHAMMLRGQVSPLLSHLSVALLLAEGITSDVQQDEILRGPGSWLQDDSASTVLSCCVVSHH